MPKILVVIPILCIDYVPCFHYFICIDSTTEEQDAAAAALMKTTNESRAATTAVALAWPTMGYALFIPYLLVHVITVYVLFVDVSIQGYICGHKLSFRYEIHIVMLCLLFARGLY